MEELTKAGEEPAPTPTRFTRSEQARRFTATESAAEGAADGADGDAVDEGKLVAEKSEPDPWDFQEAVDITTKIPSNFQENLTSPKWQERKSALEGVLALLKSHSKLDPAANYGDLMESLKNVKGKLFLHFFEK